MGMLVVLAFLLASCLSGVLAITPRPATSTVAVPALIDAITLPPATSPEAEPPLFDDITPSPSTSPVAEPPLVDDITPPPDTSPTAEPPLLDAITAPPATSPVAEPPLFDDITPPPATNPAAAPPPFDAITQQPSTSPAAEPPLFDDIIPPPATNPVAEPPLFDPITPPPATTPTAEPVPPPCPITNDFIDAHNEARAAVNVGPLTWNEKLANFSTLWVEYQRDYRGCMLADLHNSLYGYSQHRGDSPVTPRAAVESLVAEKKYYNYANNSCMAAAGRQCTNYTQVVWRNSLELGCAQATCHRRFTRTKTLTICFYNPPGNVGDERPF